MYTFKKCVCHICIHILYPYKIQCACLSYLWQIAKIENIGHLSELRVLNLARNLLTVVENLNGLDSLTELNLRHNQVSAIVRSKTLVLLFFLFHFFVFDRIHYNCSLFKPYQCFRFVRSCVSTYVVLLQCLILQHKGEMKTLTFGVIFFKCDQGDWT